MWRITDPKALGFWAILNALAAVGWVINAFYSETILSWGLAIGWLALAAGYVIRLIRVRRMNQESKTAQ